MLIADTEPVKSLGTTGTHYTTVVPVSVLYLGPSVVPVCAHSAGLVVHIADIVPVKSLGVT